MNNCIRTHLRGISSTKWSFLFAFQDLLSTAEFPDHLEEIRAVLLKVKRKKVESYGWVWEVPGA